MYSPKFELRSFDTVGDAAKSRALVAMLEALIAINEGYFIERPDTPELYASGIPYVEEPVGRVVVELNRAVPSGQGEHPRHGGVDRRILRSAVKRVAESDHDRRPGAGEPGR